MSRRIILHKYLRKRRLTKTEWWSLKREYEYRERENNLNSHYMSKIVVKLGCQDQYSYRLP